MTMFLSVTALSTPMAATTDCVFSPSNHPFMKRVVAVPTHFSFDPYKAFRAQLMGVAAVSKKAISPSSFNVSSKKGAATAPTVVSVHVGTEDKKVAAAPTGLSFRIATVAFKQGAAKFRAPFRLTEGDIVVIEGDRGEHIGTVKAIHPAAETEALAPTVTSKIIRRATASDLELLATRREKESAVLADVCKIAKDVRLNASIADVEYQFDNNKLTIYVERASSTTFVDFRKVQRTLFKMFHCRIWFVYMDELTN